MAKNWWFKLDFKVWRTDSNLRRCSLETRGFWLECLCAMQEMDAFLVEGTYEELGWLIGCSPEVVARCVVELQRTKTADVTLGNGSVTLLSRRLKRELSDREQTRLRVQRHRRNADVTVQSKEKEVISKKEEEKSVAEAAPPTPKRGTRIPDVFLLTSEMKAWGKERRPSLDLVLETEKFVNHFRSLTGRTATKMDWRLTWNNWILNARENGNGKSRTEREKSAERGSNAVAIINELRRQAAEEQTLSSGKYGISEAYPLALKSAESD